MSVSQRLGWRLPSVAAGAQAPNPGRRGTLTVVLLLPSALFLGLFVLLPLLRGVQLSVYSWDGVAPMMRRVWLDNYAALWTDPRFLLALARTVVWWAMHLVLAAGAGLVIAALIAELRRSWYQTVFRSLAFLPHVLSLAVVGVVWSQLYNPTVGLVNTGLRAVGLDSLAQSWLGSPGLALPAVGVASAWQAYGMYMVIFLAGMQAVDPALHEAAMIDGANRWQRFRHVTLPGLHGTITLVVVLAFINALKGFGTVWAMTQGGPNTATELAAVYVWRKAFQTGNVGVASAGGLSIAAIALTIGWAANRIRDRRRVEA